MLHYLGSPGRWVAGSPSQIFQYNARLHINGKVACLASPQVAGSPSQIFQYNARLHVNGKVA